MDGYKETKTGTTTLGIIFKEGVILAADKKVTMGSIISSTKFEKVVKINDRVAVTIAGSVSEVQLLTKILRAQLKLEELRRGKTLKAVEVANMLGSLVYSNIRKMSMIPAIAGFLMAVKDNEKVRLYDMAPDGSIIEFDNYVADGSGFFYALGVLDSDYKPNMTLEQAKELAIRAINSAIQRDTASGGGIDIYSVTAKGVEKIYAKQVENRL